MDQPTPPHKPVENTEVQPVAPVVAPVAAVPVPKPKKKWLPWAIAGGTAAVVVGGMSAYYFLVYQNPTQVLYDAYLRLQSAKVVQMNGVVEINKESNGVTFKSVEYKTNSNSGPNVSMDITAKLRANNKDISVGGKGMYTQDGTMYFQLNGLADAYKELSKDSAGQTYLTDQQIEGIKKLQDQWVKVTIDDIKKASQEAGTMYKCVLDAYKKHKDDDSKPMQDMYRANPFISVKEKVGTKDGNIGIKLNFDAEKYKAYTKAAEDTAMYKDLMACSKSKTTSSDTSTKNIEEITDKTSVTAWVSEWSHELRSVDYSSSFGSGKDKVDLKGSVAVAYDKNNTVTAPSGTITIDEFMNRTHALTMGVIDDMTYVDPYYSDSYSDSNL